MPDADMDRIHQAIWHIENSDDPAIALSQHADTVVAALILMAPTGNHPPITMAMVSAVTSVGTKTIRKLMNRLHNHSFFQGYWRVGETDGVIGRNIGSLLGKWPLFCIGRVEFDRGDWSVGGDWRVGETGGVVGCKSNSLLDGERRKSGFCFLTELLTLSIIACPHREEILALPLQLRVLFGMEGTVCWSDLPQCLLELILQRLSMPDRLLFGSVCRSWCIAKRQCRVLPFIVFYRFVTPKDTVEIFSLPDKRRYKTLVHEIDTWSRFFCISSSHGWMLFQPHNTFFKSLLVKNEERVVLPRLELRVGYLDCLFFSTPFDPDGVIFVRKSNNTFLLYRCCERQFYKHQWRETVVSNTIFFEGKLYTLSINKGKKRKSHSPSDEDWVPQYEDWNLAVIDPLFPDDSATVNMKLKLRNNTQLLPTLENHVFVLVESCGEMLTVRMMGNGGRNVNCDVFRADLTEMEWMKVENLGDRTLFLSHGSSVSVSASEMSCKGNHIYYIPTLSDRYKAMCKAFRRRNMPFVEFELGGDRMIIHSLPEYLYSVVGCAWLTP